MSAPRVVEHVVKAERDSLQPSVLPLELTIEPRDAASRSDRRGKPWGPWSTIGFGVLIFALWSAAQIIAAVILTGQRVKASDLTTQGWLVARMTIITAPIVVGATVLLARLRKGISVAEYLGLVWPRAPHVVRWSAIFLGFIIASDALAWALGRFAVPEQMIAMFRTPGSLPIFFFGIAVAGPIAEEFLFRGFLFTGLRGSRLGPIGAIVLTTFVWAGLHVHYDLYATVVIAVSGVLFGLARWRTGSLWLSVLLHGLMNAIATVEALFSVG